MMTGNSLHTTVHMEFLIFKVYISIVATVQWHMLTPSEPTFLLRLCID